MVNHWRRKCATADSSGGGRIFNSPFGRCNLKSAAIFQERCPVEAEPVGALHVYINNFSDQFFAALKDDNLVCACSTHQSCWIGLTRAFAKNFNRTSNETLARAAR